MSTTKTLALACAALTLGLAASANAQFSFGISGPRGGQISFGTGGVQPGFVQPVNFTQPGQPFGPRRKIVTQPTITHVDPWTGRVITQNQEVHESVNDFGRDQSRNNGTMRRVNRPVRDAWGRVVGYEQGVEWYNSFTGQRHHETTKTTFNGGGGINNTHIAGSVGSSARVGASTGYPNQSVTRTYGVPQANVTHGFGSAAAPTP